MAARAAVLAEQSRTRSRVVSRDTLWLVGLALVTVVVHVLTNGQYGWHRDELATLDDARYLDWGYVAYPPIVPSVARLGLELFGASLVGIRLFADLAVAVAIVLTGLMARELGGSFRAQIAAALALTVAPVVILQGCVFMYVTLDYLWWVVAAYLLIRLLKTDDPRYWLGIGAAIGLGMMTKYTMAFFVAGIVAGVLVTRARRYLLSPWLWAGAALALLIFLPNLVWQAQHQFISLDFLGSIHTRDIAWGRTSSFLPEQLAFCAHPFTIPLWVAGLAYCLRSRDGARYRAIGVTFLVSRSGCWSSPRVGATTWRPPTRCSWPPAASSGRGGSAGYPRPGGELASRATFAALVVGGALFLPITLPVAPVNSDVWKAMVEVHGLYVEEIGWPGACRDGRRRLQRPACRGALADGHHHRQLRRDWRPQPVRQAARPARGDRRDQLLLAPRLRRPGAREARRRRVHPVVCGPSLRRVLARREPVEPVRSDQRGDRVPPEVLPLPGASPALARALAKPPQLRLGAGAGSSGADRFVWAQHPVLSSILSHIRPRLWGRERPPVLPAVRHRRLSRDSRRPPGVR